MENQGWIAKKFIVPIEQPIAPQVDRWLEVHFVDVGQGDAIWIITPDDEIDGNGEFEGLTLLSMVVHIQRITRTLYYLTWNTRAITELLLTH